MRLACIQKQASSAYLLVVYQLLHGCLPMLHRKRGRAVDFQQPGVSR